VGRPSWQRVTGAERKQAATAAPASGSPESSEGRNTLPAAKSADSDTVEPADDSVKAGGARTSKSNPDEASGGLVVYQNGKVIFRQTPRAWPGGRASAELKAPQPDPEATEKVAAVFLSPQMASGRLIQRIEPVYPEPALEQRIQGEVELEALVGKDGFVEQLKLVSGDAQLAAAAADAVRRWRFRPYQSDGQAVEFSTHVSVDFRLP
jgi:TonB family protein